MPNQCPGVVGVLQILRSHFEIVFLLTTEDTNNFLLYLKHESWGKLEVFISGLCVFRDK